MLLFTGAKDRVKLNILIVIAANSYIFRNQGNVIAAVPGVAHYYLLLCEQIHSPSPFEHLAKLSQSISFKNDFLKTLKKLSNILFL